MKLSKQERMLVLIGLLLVAGIVFLVSMSCFVRTVSHWDGARKERAQGPAPEIRSTFTPGAFDNPTHSSAMTPTPQPRWTPVPVHRIVITPTRVPTRARPTPTPDLAIATIEAILSGCGGLSEYEMQKIYWSMVVAQDEAESQAEAQGRRTVDYALADLAVMTYFSITARTLECIKTKGTKENWPIPSR